MATSKSGVVTNQHSSLTPITATAHGRSVAQKNSTTYRSGTFRYLDF
jgi:hypothetical protein